jgi:UDPglucose--hexose-1-phosphate uridylyltransferase
MANNKLRKDYLLNRWVVIAEERKKRPTDFIKKNNNKEKDGNCPLCPNNEFMTPPAELVYLHYNGKLIKDKDKNGFRHKDWIVRVVPNLYPVFSPLIKEKKEWVKEKTELKNAIGHHEVIIESRHHNEHPSVSRINQLENTIKAYIDRTGELSKKSYVKYISIFRNHRQKAGASLAHPHSQLITTPFIPTNLDQELEASIKYWKKTKQCIFCDILKKEKMDIRCILENSSYFVFAPWASINPFEFWIIPKRHKLNILDLSSKEIKDLALAIRVTFGGLRSLLNDPAYNFGFHMLLNEDNNSFYHWHLEVYPKLAIWAGFEKSTGMFINTISPENAAQELRAIIKVENEEL